jgi:hypothetical protein
MVADEAGQARMGNIEVRRDTGNDGVGEFPMSRARARAGREESWANSGEGRSRARPIYL